MGFGGRQLMGGYNNQPIFGFNVRECIGEEARPGRNMWGGRLPVVWCDELIDKKKREEESASALGGRRLMGAYNNQP